MSSTRHTPTYLAAVRHLMGLTIREMAEICAVNDRRIRAWLAGDSSPSPAAAQRLDEAFADFQHTVEHRVVLALRSRTRPVELRAESAEQLPVLSAVSMILTHRGVESRIVGPDAD